MRISRIGLAWAVPFACVPAVHAQTAPALPPADADPEKSAAATSGVLVFAPDFFASAKPNTALDMILRLPGFALDIGSDARGLSGSAGNVLIDGDRPSSKSDALNEVLLRIAAGSVERIELIRGGAPGIDMQGRSVIANVIVKRVARTEIVAEVNSYVYTDGFLGPSGKLQYSRREGDRQTEASIYATRDRTGGTRSGSRRRYDAANVQIQDADLDQSDHLFDVNARGSIQRIVGGGKLRVNALVDYTKTDSIQAIRIRSGSGFGSDTADRNRQPSGELGFNWTRNLGPRTELDLTGLQRLNTSDYAAVSSGGGDTSEFGSRTTGGESIARAALKFRQSDVWAFEGGGEIAYNFLDSSTRFSQNDVSVPLPNAAVLVSEVRGEGFAQATWHPSAKVTLVGTLRVEVSRIAQSGDTDLARSFVYPKPRVQLTWLPSEGNQIRFRIEKEVGQLDFSDFAASSEINLGTVAGGNAELKPQRATVFESVYERRFWSKGVVEISYQHRLVRDIVDFIPLVGGFDALGNIGKGTRDVVQLRGTLPLDRLGIMNGLLGARATINASHVTDPLTGERRRFSAELPFGCGISYSQDLKGGRFSYGAEHGCNVDSGTSYRVREQRYAAVQPYISIYGTWKPTNALTLRIDLGNISNASTRSVRDIYSGPRNTAPLAFREDRMTRQGQFAFLQFRKTL